MNERIKLKGMLYFTLSYLLLFTVISVYKRNYEFLYYTIIMSTLIVMIILYHKKLHLTTGIWGSLTIVGALHIFGGNIILNSTRLYDTWLIKGLLRYDHVVHFLAIFVATLIAYSLLSPHLKKELESNRFLLSLILILIALGLGAVIELIELFSSVFLNAAEQVGDYLNNALDILFNLLGAVAACFYLMYYHKRKKH
ncbi:DUF2238 domain-containing protein [Candidatus Woesearchaeota archaeon]|nr:DUF2238 domain-containing protein [Candidatus Woesearchaeota archaeon]